MAASRPANGGFPQPTPSAPGRNPATGHGAARLGSAPFDCVEQAESPFGQIARIASTRGNTAYTGSGAGRWCARAGWRAVISTEIRPKRNWKTYTTPTRADLASSKNGLPEGKPLICLVAGANLNLRPSGYEAVLG